MFIVVKRPLEGTVAHARRIEAAARPHVHINESEAVDEAERLTKAHPGYEFIVFKAIASVAPAEAPVKVTRFE